MIARLSEHWGLRPVPSRPAACDVERLRTDTAPRRRQLAVLVVTAAVATSKMLLIVRSSLDGLAGDADRFGQPWLLLAAGREAATQLTSDPRRDRGGDRPRRRDQRGRR